MILFEVGKRTVPFIAGIGYRKLANHFFSKKISYLILQPV